MSIDTIEVMAKVILEQCAKVREEQEKILGMVLGIEQENAVKAKGEESAQDKEAEDGDK